MTRVLRRLGCLEESITMKGKVACEISAGDELVLAEVVLSGMMEGLKKE